MHAAVRMDAARDMFLRKRGSDAFSDILCFGKEVVRAAVF